MRNTSLWALSLILLVGAPDSALSVDLQIDLGRGNVTVTVPSSYEPGSAMPLILALHGYGGSHEYMETWWNLASRAEEHGFFVAHPDGTMNSAGQRFWNGTDACCDFEDTNVDDAGYLMDLIEAVADQVDVDPQRIYVCGHSNGGFMSYRMACEYPETIAAIASMAGATWDDPFDCDVDSPVHVLQIHGTADGTVLYDGGEILGVSYPSATGSAERWASVADCSLIPDNSTPAIDLDTSIPGAETDVAQYLTDCVATGSAELWTVNGAGHAPGFHTVFSQQLVEFFLAHPKAEPTGVDDSVESGDLGGGIHFVCSPNPFSGGAQIEFQLGDPGSVAVSVLSASGRRIRSLLGTTSLGQGRHSLDWDGKSDQGRPLPAGVYFVHAVVDGELHTTQVVQLER